MEQKLQFISAGWSCPGNVRALTTTRIGGVSQGPYASLNLGDHVGDVPDNVRRNRTLLCETLKLPSQPLWLEQVHGTRVVDAAVSPVGTSADGAYTNQRGVVCAVLTADCLPIFLCDEDGTNVAVLHAGWRGLAAGVIDAGVASMGSAPQRLIAHVGPAIGPGAYEVGDELRETFEQHDPAAAQAFLPRGSGHWLADLPELAHMRLRALGVARITVEEMCTFREQDKFFSYRRDGRCGRMASLIWLE